MLIIAQRTNIHLSIALNSRCLKTMFVLSNSKNALVFPFPFVFKRFMFKSRELAAKSTFNCLKAICAQDVIDKVSITNYEPFIGALYDYAMNHNMGIVQQKGALIHHMFRQKYSSESFKNVYAKKNPESIVEFATNVFTDSRIFSELPVIFAFEYAYKANIQKILLTCDAISTTFDKQNQTNPDCIADLASILGFKQTYQDVKSGMNITKHMTRGSLGILTYDANQQSIPFTNNNFDLMDYNKTRIRGIAQTVKDISDLDTQKVFYNALTKSNEILKYNQNIFSKHDNIQNILWNDIQCHPLYKRSISFIFTATMHDLPYNPEYDVYKREFCSLLSNKTYDLNRTQDKKDIFNAMLKAYRTVDPKMAQKIQYYQESMDLKIDRLLIQSLAEIIKSKIT